MHVELKVVYAASLAVTGTATASRPQVSDARAKHLWHVPDHFAQSQELLAVGTVGTICAFIGSFMSQPVLQKVTLATVQIVVAGAMLLIGVGLAAGLV